MKSHSYIILGTGRSGTSMVAGMFRSTGHYLGDDYISRRRANPTGFFEDSLVNGLNDNILHHSWELSVSRKLSLPVTIAHRERRAYWMASPLFDARRELSNRTKELIRERCSRTPFCYKDPRFSVTIPVWKPYLPEDTRFIVVFRDPIRTAESMLREARESYDPPLSVKRNWLLLHWKRTYSAILEYASTNPTSWHFLAYDDLLTLKSVPGLEQFVGMNLETDHINPSVSRSAPNSVPEDCIPVWQSLLQNCTHAA